MFKKLTFIGFLSLVVAFSSYAHDSDRIEQIERDLQETKERISTLESKLRTDSNNKEVIIGVEGWKSVASWRKLEVGMSFSTVKDILGSAHRVSGGSFTRWDYNDGGFVVFLKEKLIDGQNRYSHT